MYTFIHECTATSKLLIVIHHMLEFIFSILLHPVYYWWTTVQMILNKCQNKSVIPILLSEGFNKVFFVHYCLHVTQADIWA